MISVDGAVLCYLPFFFPSSIVKDSIKETYNKDPSLSIHGKKNLL